MGGIYLVDTVRRWLRRKKREKLLETARSWPIATGEVLNWKTVAADEELTSFAAPDQIEAQYYFTVNQEYFGGHFRSAAMSKAESHAIAAATPEVQIRYDPANPDTAVVLAEDNVENLPFRVLSGY